MKLNQFKLCLMGEIRPQNRARKWTSPTLGTGSTWVWLLRSRPDQVTKPPCEEARPLTFYRLLLVE
ncbi:MAG: hypothetical protein RLZZ410_1173 [Pseudomonadota bacterium]|jgi:hypothetical protein